MLKLAGGKTTGKGNSKKTQSTFKVVPSTSSASEPSKGKKKLTPQPVAVVVPQLKATKRDTPSEERGEEVEEVSDQEEEVVKPKPTKVGDQAFVCYIFSVTA